MVSAELENQPAVRKRKNKIYITRFSTSQRIEHIVLMVTFIVLSVTGLVQLYSTMSWAQWIILRLGGIEFTRLIHRGFAIIFILSFVYHGVNVLYAYFIKHRKLTMVPTLKDFKDIVNTMRYTFGFVDKPPRLGRYDYRQKFEYWGLIFGGTVIIVTGLILMFPLGITRFLPGQVVAAAVTFHGFEATLAVLTIVVWHLYDVIFRPGVFPADTSIFTGKVTLERMLEEHPLEYEEMLAAAEGEPEAEGALAGAGGGREAAPEQETEKP